jgi:DNA processing protein
MDLDLPFRVAFSCILEVGPVKFSQLISAFGSAELAWKSGDKDMEKFGWGEVTSRILEARKRINPQKEYEKCLNHKITPLVPEDPAYPSLLKEIHDPPFLLYVRGQLLPEDNVSLTVVGSRKMTSYGEQVIESFVPQLVGAGLTIVSGLALGVDGRASEVAYKSGGRVTSVVASGVDNPTPYTNAQLALRIVNEGRGALVSEFPLGTNPQPFYFPRRDRLVSGLSLGTLVIEAAEKSGSLITPKYALEQGREVFAVPGSIFSLVSVGTNNLIKESGAKLVNDARDILEELGAVSKVSQAQATAVLPASLEEELVLKVLVFGEEVHVDDIVRKANLPVPAVGSVLTVMELKGMVKNIGGGYYRRA